MILSVFSINDVFADHTEVTISAASGSSTPGCETTAEGCYIPKEATVDVGGNVIFSNTDTAAHTFTAGIAGNPTGEFDSGLAMAASSYEWTPTTVGEFPYYCMVHPWMTGLIVVQEAGAEDDGEEMHIPPTDTDVSGPEDCTSDQVWQNNQCVDSTSTPKNDLNLYTNKVRYGQGDVVVVTGMIDNIENLSTGDVAIIVRAPDNNIVTIAKVYPNSDGSFETSLKADGPQFKLPGKYTILANFSGLKSTITFEFTGGSGNIISDGEEHTDESGTGMLSDGTKVSVMASGENMEIVVEFENSEHVNYDIMATQNGVILNDIDVHSHDGEEVHETAPFSSDPIKVIITFQGYGVDDPKTGPIGEQIVLNIVPEFGDSDNENDIPPGDLPYEITISTASGSGAPGCEETSQGCFIPSTATVDVGGRVIFSNTDTAAHTYTAGTPTDGPSGEFDSSLVMAASSYEWTPTREGQVPYFCMVHPWMVGVIFVGEGTYIPPQPEDDFDLQVIMGNSVYDLLDTATINFSIDGITTPQNVALEVSGPSGSTVISRSFMIDSEGIGFEFRIDENFKTGTYKVVATTSNNGNTVSDTAYFKVKSQYNSFKITSVQVTDQQGNPSNLEKGEMGFIKVNLEANKSITTLVTVNLFDSDLTSIGIGSIKTTLSSGNSEIILSFMIPVDASIGPANIYVNAFSDWPSNGGIPLTGEVSITENIE